MSAEPLDSPGHHHTLRERLDAAELAADEVVADEGGQLAGEVSGLALPFEQAFAAVRAALHPHDAGHDAPEHPAPEPKVTEEPPSGDQPGSGSS